MRTLFLAPHNDDEVLFGTFLLLRYRPDVIICLRSERMGDPNYPGGMPIRYQTRELETSFAMKQLDCQWTQWPIGDTNPDAEVVETWMNGLRDLASQDDWDIVFAPAVEENGHEQHNMIGRLADIVFPDVERIHYLTYTPEGRSRDGTEVEFEPDWIAKKLSALACYKSQAAHPATRSHFIDNGLREYIIQ